MEITRAFIERHGGGEIFGEAFAPFLRMRGKRFPVIAIRAGGDLDNESDAIQEIAPEAYHTIALILIRTAGNYLQHRSRFSDFCSRDYAVAAKLHNLAAYAMRAAFHAQLFYGTKFRENRNRQRKEALSKKHDHI